MGQAGMAFSSPRVTRLKREFEKVSKLVAESGGTLKLVSASGSPPTRYVIEYHCPSLVDLNGSIRNVHQVEISLPYTYPLTSPEARMLTPVCNPHVFEHNAICLGALSSAWVASSTLDLVILNIGALLQLDRRVLNPHSLANSAAFAWIQRNPAKIPLGRVSFLPGAASQPPRIEWN